MSQLVIAVSADVVSQALDIAQPKHDHADSPGDRLYGASAGALQTAFDEAWTKLRRIVEKSVRVGWQQITEEVRLFAGFVKQTIEDLGAQGQMFLQFVLDKIRETVNALVDSLLRFLRVAFEVGERSYTLASIEVEHKIVFSVDIETNLLSLCKLAGEGELAIKGSYRLPPEVGATRPASG